MSGAVIELKGVVKEFGQAHGAGGVDLRVEAGQTYAFLGRNGSGKSTTIRMLLGLLKPEAGTVRVLLRGWMRRRKGWRFGGGWGIWRRISKCGAG